MATPVAYRIETERLVVRGWTPSDAAALKSAVDASRDHLRPWLAWVRDEEPLAAWVERLRRYRGMFDLGQDYLYAAFDRDERALLGGAGLHTRAGEGAREIGYWVHAGHVRSGFATECVAALTWVALAVDRLERVTILCDPANVASVGVPKKLGYRLEGTLRHARRDTAGAWHDRLHWSLLRDEFATSPSARYLLRAYDAAGALIASQSTSPAVG